MLFTAIPSGCPFVVPVCFTFQLLHVVTISWTKCFKLSLFQPKLPFWHLQPFPKRGFRQTISSDLSIFRNWCLKLNQQCQPSIELHLSSCNETEITFQFVNWFSIVTEQNLWLELTLKSIDTNRDCSLFKCLSTFAVTISRMKCFYPVWFSVYLLRVAPVTFRRNWIFTNNSLPKKL